LGRTDSLTGSDEEPPSGKRGRRHGKHQLGPKKVGRPITFQGDINDPALTDADRRRIKRRARTMLILFIMPPLVVLGGMLPRGAAWPIRSLSLRTTSM